MEQHIEAGWVEGVNAMKYTVVIEKSPSNYAAYVPDLPGCVATGSTKEEVLNEIRDAIAFHVESLLEHGEAVPHSQTTAAIVDAEVLAAG